MSSSADWSALVDMHVVARRIVERLSGLSLDDFLADPDAMEATWARLVVLGEAAGRVSSVQASLLPEVDLASMRGFRNVLVHAYHRVDWELVWNATQQEIPLLLEATRRVLTGAGFGPDQLEGNWPVPRSR